MAEAPRRPPLADTHDSLGAKTTPFGGWEMPVSYAGITEEHHAVRSAAGVFDVSHMGQLAVTGPDATSLVDRLTTNAVATLEDGEAHYSTVVDEEGIILDDVLVYRRAAEDLLVVPNAGHDEAIADRFGDYRDEWGASAQVENLTGERAMLAVQGPEAPAIVDAVSAADLTTVPRFGFVETRVGGVDCLVARTGYTGEDGFELVAAAGDAEALWDAVGDAQPCGLGARDTLRTEMGFLLSGQEFDAAENPRTPFEAGVGFVVDLDTDFVGRDALAAERDAGGPDETLVGFVLTERGVPRHGYPILDGEGEEVGAVTSGTMSPTLGDPIGLGYVPTELAATGSAIHIAIRGAPKSAEIRATPFIDRHT